jgi:putative transposase
MKGTYSKLAPKDSQNPAAGINIHLDLDRSQVQQMLGQQLNGLATELGLLLAVQFLEQEVGERCGPRYQRPPDRMATRHGRQAGVINLAGQKVPISKPRVRYVDGRGEVELSTYATLQRDDAMPESALRRMVRGVSCRDYEEVVERAADGFGIKRSSVSRAFVRASAGEIRELVEGRLDAEHFLVVFIDGVEYAEETMVVAMGVTEKGHKRVLGLRQGATENAEVCTALLTDLRDRGLATDCPTLFVLDGAKALAKAVKDVWGSRALIQRCQVHKKRNVQAHVPKTLWPAVKTRLGEAYGQTNYSQARKLLQATVKWLERKYPDAAASLREGMEETLTVVRLGVTGKLRQTLATTNPIESALSMVRRVTSRVRRWQEGDMRLRWCAAGLLRAESKFHRIKGHCQLTELQEAMTKAVEKNWQDDSEKVA